MLEHPRKRHQRDFRIMMNNISIKESNSIRFQKCLRILSKINPDNEMVLDIGGCDTSLKKYGGFKTVVLDTNSKADIIHDINHPIKVIGGNGGKFDFIFCGEIIEHMLKPKEFLENIKHNLSEDGYLLLTTPNMASLRNRLRLLFGKQPVYTIHWYKHYFIFTFQELKDLLNEHGFKIIEYQSDGWLFTNKIKWIGYLSSIFKSLGHHHIILCKKI